MIGSFLPQRIPVMTPQARTAEFSTDATGPRSSRRGLAALALAVSSAALGGSIANVALPDLARAFSIPFAAVQWIVLAYFLAATVLVVAVGALGDRLGRRRLLIGGIALFTIASAVAGLAPSFSVLVAARAAQGLGAAAMLALAMALIGDIAGTAKTGSTMGVIGTVSAVGTAFGPSLGGMLLDAFGWRAVFFATVPLGLAALGLAFRSLPKDAVRGEGGRPRFDLAGTVLLALALAAYALAMTVEMGSGVTAALVVTALLGAGLFVAWERRAPAPVVRIDAFADPGFSAALAANVAVFSVMVATLVVGPFYLARGAGLDAGMVGLVMAVGPVTSALTGIPAGRLVDRFGARRIALLGLAAMALGTVALALLPPIYGLVVYVVALVIITPGYQMFQSANNTAVMASVTAERRGVTSGMLTLSRNLGLITGAAALGAVFAAAAGTADMAQASVAQVEAGLRATFLIAAGLIACALLGIAAASAQTKRGGSAAPDQD